MKMWATCIYTFVYEHKHYSSVVADHIAELARVWVACTRGGQIQAKGDPCCS